MNDDRHVLREHYDSVVRGELDRDWLDRRFREHARGLCRTCQAEYLSWVASRGPSELRPESLLSVLRRVERELRAQLENAEVELKELLRMPAERQEARVSRATKRFRGPMLADLLVGESARRVFSNPAEAERFARLAYHVTLRSEARVFGFDPRPELTTRALAHQANAQRVRGDVRSAERAMTRALEGLDRLRSPWTRAEVAALAASLRRDQRRFRAALKLSEQAIVLYREVGEQEKVGEELLVKSHILHDKGALPQAIQAVEEALRALGEYHNPRLHLCAEHLLTAYLVERGAFGHARRRLDDTRALYDLFADEPTIQLRRRWVEAWVAEGLGETAEAEAAFAEVRDGFLALGNGYDAALVSLELALLYQKQGRTEEIQELARAILPVFRTQDVHREALAALALFIETASRERVSEQFLSRLKQYLVQARRDPSQPFGG